MNITRTHEDQANRMHTRAEHIIEWLAAHKHWVLDAERSGEFNHLLSTFPWTTSHIRWSSVPHTRIELSDDAASETFWEQFRTTPVGRHQYVFLMYAAHEPGIVCSARDALPDLDLLYSGAPGPRYFCGADLQDGHPKLRFTDFAEYDGLDLVRAYVPGV
ncbi:hypothetical protein ABZ135_11930 [Streptomyces sp. NPDC006339]|uniref:hypothetical protein n=1 Tax=Streptomyces sp. NPDC006339 TaxID=3156755 RepID=UPI0033B59063